VTRTERRLGAGAAARPRRAERRSRDGARGRRPCGTPARVTGAGRRRHESATLAATLLASSGDLGHAGVLSVAHGFADGRTDWRPRPRVLASRAPRSALRARRAPALRRAAHLARRRTCGLPSPRSFCWRIRRSTRREAWSATARVYVRHECPNVHVVRDLRFARGLRRRRTTSRGCARRPPAHGVAPAVTSGAPSGLQVVDAVARSSRRCTPRREVRGLRHKIVFAGHAGHVEVGGRVEAFIDRPRRDAGGRRGARPRGGPDRVPDADQLSLDDTADVVTASERMRSPGPVRHLLRVQNRQDASSASRGSDASGSRRAEREPPRRGRTPRRRGPPDRRRERPRPAGWTGTRPSASPRAPPTEILVELVVAR
jgi:hypothetical protein